jgi:hypothetical protein
MCFYNNNIPKALQVQDYFLPLASTIFFAAQNAGNTQHAD